MDRGVVDVSLLKEKSRRIIEKALQWHVARGRMGF